MIQTNNKLTKWSIIPSVKIDKIWYEWVWVSTYTDGRKVIVSWWVLPWTVADLKVVQLKKDWIKCHVHQVIKMDDSMITSKKICPHYLYHPQASETPQHKRNCGGCKRQIMDYDNQLKLKKQIVEDSFRHNSNKDINILDTLGSPDIFGYRNKIEYSFGKYITWKKENLQRLSERSVGFHKQGDFGKIVDIDICLLVDEKVNRVFTYMKKLLSNYRYEDNQNLPVYDQITHKWVLRHMLIRQGKNTDQIMVILSLSDKQISQDELRKLKQTLSQDQILKSSIDTFVMIYNNWLADIVSWPESIIENLWWDGTISEVLDIRNNGRSNQLSFDISPKSFFQTNTHWCELLYNTAIKITKDRLDDKYAQENNKWLIVDLYCGAGTIGISLLSAWVGDRLIGIEEVPSAIQDAENNIANNDIKWADFFVWKVEKLISINDIDKYKNKIQIWDKIFDTSLLKLIIVDPPRSWLHPDVVSFLDNLKKNIDFTLLYISCNPTTLSRDLDMFTNFERNTIQPVDMFPHTYHIENIVLMR